MKASSFCSRILISVGSIVLFATSVLSQTPELRDDLERSFTTFDVVRVNLTSAEGGGKRLSIGPLCDLREPCVKSNRISREARKVRKEGRVYDLVVEPHDLRAARYRAEDTNMVGVKPLGRSPVTTYKGKIEGEGSSEVRLRIDGLRIEGFFATASGHFFIEPAAKYSTHAELGLSVVYRAEDSLVDSPLFCESDIPGKIELAREVTDTRRIESMGALRVLELATEADLQYVNTLGGPAAANNEILGVLNMIEGTYNAELNLTIQVVYQHTWSTPDPFNGADLSAIFNAFVGYWNANFGGVARDTAHLFSAKPAAVGRGTAYIGVVCRAPANSYGVSGYVDWAPGKFLVTAHEIGHNVGADHAGAAQNCANSLMNTTLSPTTPLSFCTFSRNQISSHISLYGGCLSDAPTPPAGPAPFDFDGDGRSDISVFRPSNGVWYLNRSTDGFGAFHFGLSGDVPVASDYDGDGRADAAVFRNGIWYRLKSATNTTDVISFGLAGDVPVPADFDGDDKADVAVFRPATGTWYTLSSSTGSDSTVRFGLSGDVPVPADYDGDDRADINLFRPSTGTWYRLDSSTGSWFAMNFGLSGDKAVTGDFDGDAKADIAVWRPSDGVWYLIRSSSGAFHAQAFGLGGDIPAPADFDGDGKTDISVFRPSDGVWYRLNSSTGAFVIANFGLGGDYPVPSYYIQ